MKLLNCIALVAFVAIFPACHAWNTSRDDYRIFEKSVQYYEDGTTMASDESSFETSRTIPLGKVMTDWPESAKSYHHVEYWESGQVKVSDEYVVTRHRHARKLLEYYETGQVKRLLQQEAVVGMVD